MMENVIIDDLRTGKGYEFYALSGQGKRDNQQDMIYLAANDTDLYAVLCDGMGGLQGGQIASRTAVEALTEYFGCYAYTDTGQFDAYWMKNAIEAVDDIVYNLTDSNNKRLGAGTTLVTVCISEEKIYWASVGDSRAYIIRGKEAVRMTKDHNYEAMLIEQLQRGEITQTVYQNELVKKDSLTSFIGMGGLTYIDLYEEGMKLLPNDLILICSDGLYKTLEEDYFLLLLQQNKSVKELAEWIEETLLMRDALYQDNYTYLLIRKNF